MAFRFQSSRLVRAFTLIELMLSLLLVLMLMIGVNQIFKMSGDVVGVGMFMGDNAANQRAIGDSMRRDAGGWMKDSPFFVIHCEQITLPDGSTARRDYFSFFANGRSRRQTANDGSYSSSTTANEAFIWYGHLDPGSHYFPDPILGQDPIHDTIGRMAILLSPRNSTTQLTVANAAFPQNSPVGTQEDYLQKSGTFLSPICRSSSSTTFNTSRQWTIEQSRYDLADISADALRREIAGFLDLNQNYTPTTGNLNNGSIDYRFQGISQLPRPITSELAARNAPIMLANCSQMIVDFAEDFADQTNPTSPDYTKQDGVVDFVPGTAGSLTAPRATQWYGPNRNNAYDVKPVPLTLPQAVANRFRTTSNSSLPVTYIWLNSAPKLVRVLVKMEDPANRIPDGVWFEYILGPQ
ncbi:MAG: hypothetical protein ABSH20_03340 [Tepidisphaeraceae bacterium]